MESTMSEFVETCDKYEGTAQHEQDLARQESDLVHKLGQARHRGVQLARQLRNGGESLNVVSPDAEEFIRAYSTRRQDLVDQQALIAMLNAALERVRIDKKRATSQVDEYYRSLTKHAHDALKHRCGKTASRFAMWGHANEAELNWRTVLLNQLLYQVQINVPGSLATVRHLLSADTFRLLVLRGFFVRLDGAMKEIRPTAAYRVPQDIPARDAFEALLTGRAELAA